ncbi:Plasma membrane sulfite pump involved in sulfite metabolism [Rhinocladiella similis]
MSTIINMWVFVCVPAWGEWAVYFAWGLSGTSSSGARKEALEKLYLLTPQRGTKRLWIADATLSLLLSLYLPFVVVASRSNETPLSSYTALQLFPIIACVVASASAAIVASAIPHPHQALATVIAGYVLWGLGVPTALFVMVIYFQRLAIHKLPPREVIVSCFMPIGPLGMGGLAITKLGTVARGLFPRTDTIHPLAGDLAYNLGVFVCLIFWGFTLLWLFFAVASIWNCGRFPFNMGWWGFTFPLGTFALSSDALAVEVPSRFFRVIGAIMSVCVCLLWMLVGAATLRDLVTGGKKLFHAAPLVKKIVDGNRNLERMAQVGEKQA